MKTLLFTIALLFSAPLFPGEQLPDSTFNHRHTLWSGLLQEHVHWINRGVASQVDYRAFKQDEPRLDRYKATLSAIEREAFNSWSRNQRKAFLINAYNAFTIKLILSKYPDIESINDLGSLFSSPWSKQFFSLFGNTTSLDTIEHEMLRQPGVYDDPFIHVAVVCASIGCPALPNETFTAENIERQLNEGMHRFLADRERNRFNPKSAELEVSRIFDWYEEDFEQGHREIYSVKELLSRYAEQLSDEPQQQQLVREQKAGIDYLDYDWRLNDYRKESHH